MTTTSKAQRVVKLWEGKPPTDNQISGPEKNDNNRISNVSVPELSIYLPDPSIATGKAVIICPGGGYARLAFDHEGTKVAEWFQSQGIAGIILKYRLPNSHKTVPLEDARQAIRYVREQAAELGINPAKIGIAGFSAGGHLAATASTLFTLEGTSTRPDFSILFYPVITMGSTSHSGSRSNLLGDNLSPEDIRQYSAEKQVTANTPPAILLLSDDDQTVPPQNSLLYYEALKQRNIPATLYVFPEGGHGWGMKTDFTYHKEMLRLLSKWLQNI